MILAKVVGTVVSNQKSEKIEGIKFLLLEKIDPVTMKGKNDFVVSMDSVGAGVGEIVFFVSGSSATVEVRIRWGYEPVCAAQFHWGPIIR